MLPFPRDLNTPMHRKTRCTNQRYCYQTSTCRYSAIFKRGGNWKLFMKTTYQCKGNLTLKSFNASFEMIQNKATVHCIMRITAQTLALATIVSLSFRTFLTRPFVFSDRSFHYLEKPDKNTAKINYERKKQHFTGTDDTQ